MRIGGKGGLPPWLWIPAGLVGGWGMYSALFVDHNMPLPSAIDAPRDEFHGTHSAFLSYYADTSAGERPLVLVHSINAASSAYEMRPLFQHYRAERSVYALELPGFGFSERSDRRYSPELYRAAIEDFLRDVVAEPADVVTLSLSSEFAAAAALSEPDLFRSLALMSPSGLSDNPTRTQSSDQTESRGAYDTLANPIWAQALYDLLVIRPSIRYFLSKNFYGDPDEGLMEYGFWTSHQRGARHAPLHFLSGLLFRPDIASTVYTELTVPTLVLYDEDPNLSFEQLPTLLSQNSNWRARRIPQTRGLPHWEQLEQTTTAMDEFWSDL